MSHTFKLLYSMLSCPSGKESIWIRRNRNHIDLNLYDLILSSISSGGSKHQNALNLWHLRLFPLFSKIAFNELLSKNTHVESVDFIAKYSVLLIFCSYSDYTKLKKEKGLVALILEYAIILLINTDRWDHKRQIIEKGSIYYRNRECLNYLDKLKEHYTDNNRLENIQTHYRVLDLFQQKGLDVAFHEVCHAIDKKIASMDNITEVDNKLIMIEVLFNLLDKVKQSIMYGKNLAHLGDVYLFRNSGIKSNNIEKAIQYYEEAFEVITPVNSLQDWIKMVGNLVEAYRNRIKESKGDNIAKAIKIGEEALTELSDKDVNIDITQLLLNLGNAYQENLYGTISENIEDSIICLKKISNNIKDIDISLWAKVQNSLGVAYGKRLQGDKSKNLETCIEYLNGALIEMRQKEYPLDWARLQMSLGSAYQNRIKGDKLENLEKSIYHFNNALEEINYNYASVEWVKTQINLGSVYLNYYTGDKDSNKNIETAISHFEQALSKRPRNVFPLEWASIQDNLGIAFGQRIQGNKDDNLINAITYFREALKERTQKKCAWDWAQTQNNLGVLLKSFSLSVSDPIKNQEEAINCFTNALKERKRDKAPYEWAHTQIDLGLVYQIRLKGGKNNNLELSNIYFKNALTVFKPNIYPLEFIRASILYSKVLFERSSFKQAKEILEAAHFSYEKLRKETIRINRRDQLSNGVAKMYKYLVECCINIDDVEAAFYFASVSKSRTFTEQLLSSRMDYEEIANENPHFKTDYENLLNLELEIEFLHESLTNNLINNDFKPDIEVLNLELKAKQEKLNDVWNQVIKKYPKLLPVGELDSVKVDDILQLCQITNTCIIEYYSLLDGKWIAFVINNKKIQFVHLSKANNALIEGIFNEIIKFNPRFPASLAPIKISKISHTLYDTFITPLE